MPSHKKNWVRCSTCDTRLPRAVHFIVEHFKTAHRVALSEAEAFRIASPQKKGTPYAGEPRRSPRGFQGGAPGLGKRR
jgi:hypothetical protein